MAIMETVRIITLSLAIVAGLVVQSGATEQSCEVLVELVPEVTVETLPAL